MGGSSNTGSGNSRGRAWASRLLCILTLLAALTAAGPVAQACEEWLPRNGGPTPSAPDSGCLHRQYKDPLFSPAIGLLLRSGEEAAPRDSAGFFALHEPEHKPAAGDPVAEEEEDEGISLWFGTEFVFMFIGSDEDDTSEEEEPSELVDDGIMTGLSLSFGFGERSAWGLGFVVESGYLSADLTVIGLEERVSVDGAYFLAGPSLRFGGKDGSGSLDVLVGESEDSKVSTLVDFRFNMRAGVGPVSSGFYIGLSISLLYIGFEEDFSSDFGDLNILWGLLIGGQF